MAVLVEPIAHWKFIIGTTKYLLLSQIFLNFALSCWWQFPFSIPSSRFFGISYVTNFSICPCKFNVLKCCFEPCFGLVGALHSVDGLKGGMGFFGEFFVELMVKLGTMRFCWSTAWVAFCDSCAKNQGDPSWNVFFYQIQGINSMNLSKMH